MSVKMTKQHIFIIENNLQKVGQSFFSLVPSDNRDTRSTCPTSVFIGIGQTLMSRPELIGPLCTRPTCFAGFLAVAVGLCFGERRAGVC
jgi:hypothetical protein